MKGRKSTLLEKLAVLKENCDPDKLYQASKLARILGLNLDNTRRYLRRLKNLGFIDEFKWHHYKYYRVPLARSKIERLTGHRVTKAMLKKEVSPK